jgi:hypothetical protein
MSCDYLQKLDRVEIKLVEDSTIPPHIAVTPFWKGVDRSQGCGWGIPIKKPQLAERLRKAIESGRLYDHVEVRTDSAGLTFMDAGHPIVGRRMNASLTEMGF